MSVVLHSFLWLINIHSISSSRVAYYSSVDECLGCFHNNTFHEADVLRPGVVCSLGLPVRSEGHVSNQLGRREVSFLPEKSHCGERWGLAKSEPSVSVVMANDECVDLLMAVILWQPSPNLT